MFFSTAYSRSGDPRTCVVQDAVKTGRLSYLTVVLVGLLIAFTAFHRTVTVDTFVPLDGSFAASPARGTTPLTSEVRSAC